MIQRHECYRLAVGDEVELTQAVVHVGNIAHQMGFPPAARAMLMTAASELARNILKYAGRGAVLTARVERAEDRGLEVVAVDHGPGIPDLEKAMTDHYSTAGTLGLGLPGVRRMADEFEIVSDPRGTSVTIRKWLP